MEPIHSFTFGNPGSISLFNKKSKDHIESNNNFNDKSSCIYIYGQEELLDNRKLYAEGHSTFLVLQSKLKQVNNQTEILDIIKSFSKVYLALIKSQIDQLEQISEQPDLHNFGIPDGSTMREYDNQILLWSHMFRIWHLSDIFIISSLSYVYGSMNSWIRKNIKISKQKYNNNDYNTIWDLFYHYIIRGEFNEAIPLFRKLCGTDFDSSSIPQQIEGILSSMPKLGSSLSNFDRLWQQWNYDCKAMLEVPSILDNEYYKKLFNILTGDSKTLNSVKNIHWIELLGGYILYKYPTITNNDVGKLLSQVIDISHISSNESILADIIQGNADSVIMSIYNINNWTAAHIMDIFYHCNVLSLSKQKQEDIREQIFISYINDLLQDYRYWQIGFSYLTFCEKQGRYILAEYIERIPLDSDKKAFKLLNLCKLHKLHSQEKVICQTMAMKCLQQGRRGACMEWLERLNDENRIRQVANKMIKKAETFEDIEHILESLGADFDFSENLQFLVDYKHLLEYYKDKEYNKTKPLIIQILQNKKSPIILRLSLISEFLPKILELPDNLFDNPDDIFILMNEIEEIYLYYEVHPEELSQRHSKNIKKTRFQLIQGLSQVFIQNN